MSKPISFPTTYRGAFPSPYRGAFSQQASFIFFSLNPSLNSTTPLVKRLLCHISLFFVDMAQSSNIHRIYPLSIHDGKIHYLKCELSDQGSSSSSNESHEVVISSSELQTICTSREDPLVDDELRQSTIAVIEFFQIDILFMGSEIKRNPSLSGLTQIDQAKPDETSLEMLISSLEKQTAIDPSFFTFLKTEGFSLNESVVAIGRHLVYGITNWLKIHKNTIAREGFRDQVLTEILIPPLRAQARGIFRSMLQQLRITKQNHLVRRELVQLIRLIDSLTFQNGLDLESSQSIELTFTILALEMMIRTAIHPNSCTQNRKPILQFCIELIRLSSKMFRNLYRFSQSNKKELLDQKMRFQTIAELKSQLMTFSLPPELEGPCLLFMDALQLAEELPSFADLDTLDDGEVFEEMLHYHLGLHDMLAQLASFCMNSSISIGIDAAIWTQSFEPGPLPYYILIHKKAFLLFFESSLIPLSNTPSESIATKVSPFKALFQRTKVWWESYYVNLIGGALTRGEIREPMAQKRRAFLDKLEDLTKRVHSSFFTDGKLSVSSTSLLPKHELRKFFNSYVKIVVLADLYHERKENVGISLLERSIILLMEQELAIYNQFALKAQLPKINSTQFTAKNRSTIHAASGQATERIQLHSFFEVSSAGEALSKVDQLIAIEQILSGVLLTHPEEVSLIDLALQLVNYYELSKETRAVIRISHDPISIGGYTEALHITKQKESKLLQQITLFYLKAFEYVDYFLSQTQYDPRKGNPLFDPDLSQDLLKKIKELWDPIFAVKLKICPVLSPLQRASDAEVQVI